MQYANFKQNLFLDLRTEDHQLRMKTDRLYIMFRDIHKINNIVEMKTVAKIYNVIPGYA